MPIPTVITVYADRSLLVRDQDPAGLLLPEEGGADLRRAPRSPASRPAGRVTRAQLREIAEAKMKDLNANDIEAAARIIEGSRPRDGPRSDGELGPWRS